MIREPFGAEDRLFCSRCGRECVEISHLFSRFLLCPVHGEFTIAPVVIWENGQWFIQHRDETAAGMWETCAWLDTQFPNEEGHAVV